MNYQILKKYSPKRQVYDLSGGIPSGSADCVIVCVPKLGWDIARSFLSERGLWDSSYASEYFTNGYKTLSEAQWDVVETLVSQTIGACEVDCGDLITAINGISTAITSSASSGTCCANSGTELPQESGTDGGPIPPGAAAKDTAIVDRKCKVSNMLYDNVLEIVSLFDGSVTTMLLDLDVAGAAGVVISVLTSTVSFVGSVLLSLAGKAIEIAVYIFGGSISFSNLRTVIENNRTDLVCALFNSTSTATAEADFSAALVSAGASQDEADFVLSLLPTTALNLLFFAQPSLITESDVDAYVGTTDCQGLCLSADVFVQIGNYEDGYYGGGGPLDVSSIYQSWPGQQSIQINDVGNDDTRDFVMQLIGPAIEMSEVYLDGVNVVPWTSDLNLIFGGPTFQGKEIRVHAARATGTPAYEDGYFVVRFTW